MATWDLNWDLTRDRRPKRTNVPLAPPSTIWPDTVRAQPDQSSRGCISTVPDEPSKEPAWEVRFYSPEEALEIVRRDPRPWKGGGAYVIEDLTDEESERFWEALADT